MTDKELYIKYTKEAISELPKLNFLDGLKALLSVVSLSSSFVALVCKNETEAIKRFTKAGTIVGLISGTYTMAKDTCKSIRSIIYTVQQNVKRHKSNMMLLNYTTSSKLDKGITKIEVPTYKPKLASNAVISFKGNIKSEQTIPDQFEIDDNLAEAVCEVLLSMVK